MELIGTIIFIFGIQFIWSLIQTAFNRFEITVEKDITNIDSNNKTTVIHVKGKGILPLSKEESSEATFVTTVWDITEEKESPVLCFFPDFQLNNIYFFKKTMPIPYDKTILQDWMHLGFIIPEVCVFPKSKNRLLKVHFSILNDLGEVVKTYFSTIQFYNDQKGYEEITKDKNKDF